MMRINCAITSIIFTLVGTPALADHVNYAIVIGNNAPPRDSNLPVLKYADDDAIRYYQFFSRIAADVHLLTIPDQRTQQRYPGIGNKADMPTLDNLKRAISKLKTKIETDEESGKKTTLYLAYSGHGDYAANGDPFLSFLDGGLDGKRLYDEILPELKTDYQHVFIDACYAEGVIGFKGPFDKETTGSTTAVTNDEKTKAFGAGDTTKYPGLGIVISSSKNETTHEWSRFESGVFTHEVLSGLAGPADINLDGKIEYSELLAFISVANLEVKDSRGKIEVIAKPPARNQSVPIVDLTELKNVAYLIGDPSRLGHFFIELKNGLRYLDANLTNMKQTLITLPIDMEAYLYTASQEAELRVDSTRILNLARVDLEEKRVFERGGIEDALRKGLFTGTYGQAYYQGFIDSAGMLCVDFDTAPLNLEPSTIYPPLHDNGVKKKSFAITSLAFAGVAAAVAGTFGALSLKAKKDYENTTNAADAERFNERYMTFGTTAWISIGIVPVAALTGFLLWPDSPPPINLNAAAGRGMTRVSLSLTF